MKNKKIPLKKSDIVYHLLKNWRIILAFTLVGLIGGVSLIGVGYIRGEMTKEYRISTSIAINAINGSGKFTSRSDTPYKTDVDTARDMTETAIYIIKSHSNLSKVIEKAGIKGVTAGTIASNLTLTRYKATEVIDITLLWRSEREGLQIMRTLNEVSDSSLIEIIKLGHVSVINEPSASYIVGASIGVSTWIYATLIGLVLGVIVAILKYLLTATVINASDLENIYGMDLLATLPYDREFARAKLTNRDEDLPIHDDIKSLAHMLINRMEQVDINRIYCTSAAHNEGRTSLIANTAIYLSKLGKKTLLVDCDLKNPRLGSLFNNNLRYEQTLNALYRGDSDKIDAVMHINGCLDLLPVILEKAPENFNDAMLDAIGRIMEDYDYVLIDAAPVGEDAEVLRLNEIADAVLFVVRCDFTPADTISKALLRLDKSGISILGGVFNASNTLKDAFKKTKNLFDNSYGAVLGKRKKSKNKKHIRS